MPVTLSITVEKVAADLSPPSTGLWAEMRAVPPLDERELLEPTLDVSLLIPARGAAHSLEDTVRQAHEFLSRAFPGNFEIVLIPNPPAYPKPGAAPDRSTEVSRELAARFDRVVVAPHRLPQGKGAALRTGFKASRGRWVFFTDADLPYELGFFEAAAAQLRAGFDLVTGNRRMASSEFDVPVGLLPLAYGRHRLGLAFNRMVRWLLPIQVTDTQAGIKAMSRRLATVAFARQTCPGFFFDLELFLTALGQGFRQVELPVTLHLNSEKSTVRVLRESVLAGFWLSRIALRNLRMAYGARRIRPLGHYRRVPGLSAGTRLFLEARWRLTPYSVMASRLPPRGTILDLGCGHGLFSLALALGSAERQVVGLDHDVERVRLARAAAEGVSNVRYSDGTLSNPLGTSAAPQEAGGPVAGISSGPVAGISSGPVAGISMIDVMHYFPYPEQERLFAEAHDLLAPGGTLIVREVEPKDGLMSSWNRLYEKIATATGFTRSEAKQQLSFRTREDWEEALRKAGFDVVSERCSSILFADILYVARKRGQEAGHA